MAENQREDTLDWNGFGEVRWKDVASAVKDALVGSLGKEGIVLQDFELNAFGGRIAPSNGTTDIPIYALVMTASASQGELGDSEADAIHRAHDELAECGKTGASLGDAPAAIRLVVAGLLKSTAPKETTEEGSQN